MSRHDDNQNELDGPDQIVDSCNKQSNPSHDLVNTHTQQLSTYKQPCNARTQAGEQGGKLHIDMPAVIKPGSKAKRERFDVVAAWKDYFGDGDLEDWIRLCRHLTLEGDLSTKYKCKKALSTVWVNIWDFLNTREEVALFATEEDLSKYTRRTDKIYPMCGIEKGSPLESLLAYVVRKRPKKTSRRGSKKRAKGRCTKTPNNNAW
ncbi:hypothetical protein BR93DRAFT_939489 [Coniochaeta sp. PMI_546]|nr:hypothetical protein BR93DRAFT_939489 [Coniochaeta sp. PMI_546]